MVSIGDGDVIPTKALRVVLQDGKGWADFKAPRGQCFVVLLLGKEEIAAGGRKIDPVQALNKLGWHAEQKP